MSDLYAEVLVKREATGADRIKKNGLVFLFAASVLLALFYDYRFLLAATVLAAVCFFLLPRMDMEFEYLLVNQELDVDKIYAKSKRKKAAQFHLEKMEVFAPLQSDRAARYQGAGSIKVRDYSSGTGGPGVYVMIIREEDGLYRVLLEPDRQMLDGMLKTFPHKVFVD